MAVSPAQVSLSRWILRQANAQAVEKLQSELGVSAFVAAVLVDRGFADPAAAHAFLHPSLDSLHDPSLLPDYQKAVDILLDARERQLPIYLHGDYDVDGVTSAALFDRFLRRAGCVIKTHVPHRMKEGYGIHLDAVEAAREYGAKILLTCDCGGSALEQIDKAKEYGMRVVVTDHHHVGEVWPNADAFVNPHRPDSQYPFPNLSGAGVVFKLCQGITRDLGWPIEKFQRAFLDLVTLGTVADVMPLLDENRIMVKHGLPELSRTKKIGLRSLLQTAGLTDQAISGLTSYHVGFQIGPRINAAGRIDDAAIALNLLLTEDNIEAMRLANELERLNFSRREQQDRIMKEAIDMVEEQALYKDRLIIVGKEGWHSGLVGIVAGRIREIYHRPAFILNFDVEKDAYHGSGRSIPGFHLAEAIRANPFVVGGGHAKAAGVEIPNADYESALAQFRAYALETLSDEDLIPTVEITSEVAASEVTLESIRQLKQLEPFGEGNPTPLFCSRKLTIEQIKPTSKPEHAMVTTRSDEGTAQVLKGFGLGERIAQFSVGDTVDAAYKMEIDEFRGQERISLILRDIKLAD